MKELIREKQREDYFEMDKERREANNYASRCEYAKEEVMNKLLKEVEVNKQWMTMCQKYKEQL